VQDEDIQPNAVDLRLDKVFKINNNIFEISNDVKMHRGSTQLPVDERDCFILQPGTYEFIMENEVSIGEHEAGFVLTRSTLIRNGCNLITGLYDSGYCGVIGGQLNVQGGWAVIKRGTRIGQFILFDAESLHKYNGDYGANKAHDDKYEVK
tara:strand:- start:3257 stop:3709 length:453 start_codon:yes stop_codon:yes gene_type:complete